MKSVLGLGMWVIWMIDIHSHVLWQIDDGSQSLAMSQAMLRFAAQQGTEAMVFTPHVIEEINKPDWGLIKEKTQQLQEWLKQEKIPLQVYPGAEVQMNWNLLPDLAVRGSYCINEGKYILIELPMEELPVYADNFWYELELKGVQPILAHPERYWHLMGHKEIIWKWRERGLLFQANSGSFTGKFGPQVQENVKYLLQLGVLDFLGSDAHRAQVRRPDLVQAVESICSWADRETLQRLLVTNPRLLLADEFIAIKPLLRNVENNKKSFWQKVLAKLV